MNERDLSTKLEQLAIVLESLCSSGSLDHKIIWDISQELRELSNENYAPGNSLSWDAVKPKPTKPQGGFISKKTGRQLPF